MKRNTLLAALFLIALAGLMLHYRIHNFMVPDKADPSIVSFDSTRFLSFIFPLVDVILVTALFLSRKTSVYGYLLNGMIVIYGTVFMAHFSMAELTSRGAPAADWITKSTLPDIAIAWGDFLVGKGLYDLYQSGQ
jgi:hypothetical protein